MNRFLLAILLLSLNPFAVRSWAQVVQLPTIQVFSVGTTVVVPDRGSTFLGGVDRASYGSNMSGVPGLSRLPGAGRLFTNRGIGSEISSSRAYASATIMDLEELDKAVLAEAASRRGVAAAHGGAVANPAIERKAAFLSRHVAKTEQARRSPAIPPTRPRKQ